jgi:acetylornithine deacetylase/succinyl-diaminopimelate desuccinylase-like protein
MPVSHVALRAIAYARAHGKKFLAELMDFIRFPSISAQPRHEGDIRNCADWVAGHLGGIGLDDVRVIPTRRHPVISASWQGAPGRPTLLIYGHYDVQPADPLDKWLTPPFEPSIRGADLFGRGACDDKGQAFAHVKALEAYLKTAGGPPINVKCLFEGEEEIGSPNLPAFLAKNARRLAADAAVVSDAPMAGPGKPVIHYGERGALSLELEVIGPAHDLHSGNFGGAVHNPLQALCEIIAQLHDASGRIAVPGLYDGVRPASSSERARLMGSGLSDGRILELASAPAGWGDHGYSLFERLTLRPALTINGIAGGYQGAGGKGVIPARAAAKLSFRLVPDQDPREIDRLFRKRISELTPATVRTNVKTLSRADPFLVNPRHPALRIAARAYERGFGVAPKLSRSGGTIPILSVFHRTLGLPVVVMGFALPDDRMHAPNEKFHIPNFFRGIETSIWFMHEFARMGEAQQERFRAEPSPVTLEEDLGARL